MYIFNFVYKHKRAPWQWTGTSIRQNELII